jgi:nicotinamidase/pyrazinamidase
LAVDLQKTFYEGGSLSVPGANSTIIIEFLKTLYKEGYPIVASQDSHPEDHVSFNSDGIWPRHAVKGARLNKNRYFEGDALLEGIEDMVDYVQPKGENPLYDSYSAFFNDGGYKTPLSDYLSKKSYKTLIVLGEAGNYCVKATIIDALIEGFNVILITDMTHYIPSTPETEADTFSEIRKHTRERAGFKTVNSEEFLKNPTKYTSFSAPNARMPFNLKALICASTTA